MYDKNIPKFFSDFGSSNMNLQQFMNDLYQGGQLVKEQEHIIHMDTQTTQMNTTFTYIFTRLDL